MAGGKQARTTAKESCFEEWPVLGPRLGAVLVYGSAFYFLRLALVLKFPNLFECVAHCLMKFGESLLPVHLVDETTKFTMSHTTRLYG